MVRERGFVAGLFLALVAALTGSASAPAADVPYLSGRVNDTAGIVPADVSSRLEDRLQALEERTGAQLAVLTVESLEGDSIEDFSMRVAETWKLGQRGKDNGVLFVVATNDRAMRIEVGYGLEGVLPDAVCKRILDGVVRPRFRAGDFGGGIEAAVETIAKAIEGDTSAVPAEADVRRQAQDMPLLARILGMLIFAVVVGVFSIVAVFGPGCQSWFLYLFLMPFYAAFPFAFVGPAGLVLFALWVVGFPIAKLFLTRTPKGKAFVKAHPALVAMAASSGHGSGGGWSSSGSSFSGGGGSFGGGGASSSW